MTGRYHVSRQISSATAAHTNIPTSRGLADRDFVVFAFIALAAAELVLVLALPGINYSSGDGKAAQAEIPATLEFPGHSTSPILIRFGLGGK